MFSFKKLSKEADFLKDTASNHAFKALRKRSRRAREIAGVVIVACVAVSCLALAISSCVSGDAESESKASSSLENAQDENTSETSVEEGSEAEAETTTNQTSTSVSDSLWPTSTTGCVRTQNEMLPSNIVLYKAWTKKTDSVSSEGFITESTAAEFGEAVLEMYKEKPSWTLTQSGYLDLSGYAWGCVLTNEDEKETRIITALPDETGKEAAEDNVLQVTLEVVK